MSVCQLSLSQAHITVHYSTDNCDPYLPALYGLQGTQLGWGWSICVACVPVFGFTRENEGCAVWTGRNVPFLAWFLCFPFQTSQGVWKKNRHGFECCLCHMALWPGQVLPLKMSIVVKTVIQPQAPGALNTWVDLTFSLMSFWHPDYIL